MKKLLVIFVGMILFGLFTLIGCSSQPPSKTAEEQKTPSKPAAPTQPEEVTGRSAFQKLYVAARGWAGDAKPFLLLSQVIKESSGKDGKSAVWRASFASPSRKAIKPYIWSGVQADDAPSPGINPGTEDTYNPSNTSTQVFDIGFLKVDSDKAFDVAQKHGGDKITKKSADQPVTYVLDWKPSSYQLIWHVVYGTGPEDAKLRVAVNASTGDFIRVEK
jgi:hypothetical protein